LDGVVAGNDIQSFIIVLLAPDATENRMRPIAERLRRRGLNSPSFGGIMADWKRGEASKHGGAPGGWPSSSVLLPLCDGLVYAGLP
jgi:hypothetical protein